jgi:glycosyltransferase involved in cell wall biosynthesis
MSQSARILYVITRPDLGGAQSHVRDLLQGFQDKYDVHLAIGKEGALTEAVTALGLKVHLLPSLARPINLIKDFQAVNQCNDLLKQLQPDLIHAHSSKAGIVARIAGRICNIPTIFTAHGWGFSPGTPLVRRQIALAIEKIGAKLGDRVICVSESDRALAMNLGVGTPEKLVTIRYGIPNQSLLIADPSQYSPRLIMVARFNEQKDQATLLQAIAQLKNTKLHLDLVGSGPSQKSCKDLAYRLQISDRVSFLGDRLDVQDLLAQSQIFILSTHYEGLPISILEAMRSGLPVVATEVNGVPEEIIHNQTGFLVPHADVDAVASALNTLVNNAQLRKKMGNAGRQKFLEEFTQEKMLSSLDKLYQTYLTR